MEAGEEDVSIVGMFKHNLQTQSHRPIAGSEKLHLTIKLGKNRYFKLINYIQDATEATCELIVAVN